MERRLATQLDQERQRAEVFDRLTEGMAEADTVEAALDVIVGACVPRLGEAAVAGLADHERQGLRVRAAPTAQAEALSTACRLRLARGEGATGFSDGVLWLPLRNRRGMLLGILGLRGVAEESRALPKNWGDGQG